MRAYPFIRYTVIIASLALISWVVVPSVQAADQPSKGKTSAKAVKTSSAPVTVASTAPTSSEAGRSTVASGAVEDSQKACLARIPNDASSGQRMLAEGSCTRDQSNRPQ